ncbi:TPA: hypothetical protein ACH3X1_012828 [Trebouxia sp. C0004]
MSMDNSRETPVCRVVSAETIQVVTILSAPFIAGVHCNYNFSALVHRHIACHKLNGQPCLTLLKRIMLSNCWVCPDVGKAAAGLISSHATSSIYLSAAVSLVALYSAADDHAVTTIGMY